MCLKISNHVHWPVDLWKVGLLFFWHPIIWLAVFQLLCLHFDEISHLSRLYPIWWIRVPLLERLQGSGTRFRWGLWPSGQGEILGIELLAIVCSCLLLIHRSAAPIRDFTSYEIAVVLMCLITFLHVDGRSGWGRRHSTSERHWRCYRDWA